MQNTLKPNKTFKVLVIQFEIQQELKISYDDHMATGYRTCKLKKHDLIQYNDQETTTTIKDAKTNFRGLGGPPNMLDKQPFIMLEFLTIS